MRRLKRAELCVAGHDASDGAYGNIAQARYPNLG